MDLLVLERILSEYKNVAGLVGTICVVVATLASAFIVYYANSASRETRKQKRMKLSKFEIRIAPEIEIPMMSTFLEFRMEHRGQNWDIRSAAASNRWTPNFLKPSKRVFSSDIVTHNEQLEFFDFIKSKGIIIDYGYSVMTVDHNFLCYEYFFTPSIKSWNDTVKRYEKSPQGKAERKLGKVLYDELIVKNRSRRMFLSWIFPSLKN